MTLELEQRTTQSEQFWQEVLAERPYEYRGIHAKYMSSALVHFAQRPLAVMDLAKIAYAEDYDSDPLAYNKRAAVFFRKPAGIRARVRQAGYWYAVRNTGEKMDFPNTPRVRYIALDRNAFLKDNALVDDTLRPSEDELRIAAIYLRQEEIQNQKNTAWEDLEEERSKQYARAALSARMALDKADKARVREMRLAGNSHKERQLWKGEVHRQYIEERRFLRSLGVSINALETAVWLEARKNQEST